MKRQLWYTKPAADWLEGLPVGTGRLAAMVMGTWKRERLALNHEWLWTGVNRARDNEPAAQHLPEVRRLLLEGRYEEGARLGCDIFGGAGGRSGRPGRVDPYVPAGDLYLELNHNTVWGEYRRELDLDTACVTVSYNADGRRFRRQVIAHLTEDLILVHVEVGSKPFSGALWLDRLFDPACDLDFAATPERLTLHGQIHGGIAFLVTAEIHARGGSVETIENHKVSFRDVTELLVAVDMGTSAKGGAPEDECRAHSLSTTDWEALLATHVAEHRRHFGSMSLDIAGLAEPDLPTDERMKQVRAGGQDPALPLLYFDYGRYLLCASSANAELPANLQGKWNEDIRPLWDCDYHHDINLEMAYWLAEPAGMQAYAEALLRHIERFVPHARKAARDLYGCEGVWYPITGDAWGRATPETRDWAVWVGAAPWLAQHMWWHYEYGRDKEYLRTRCYPFLKEVAAFIASYVIEDAAGTLQFVPSQSPENHFVGGGWPVSLCVSAAMDVELAWDTLTHAIRAAEVLGVDSDLRDRWRSMLAHLPALQVGSRGQLLEWNQELVEKEPGHRHVSHLFAAFPGEQITPQTPELFAAARRSLDLRLAAKGGHTGWSRAWTACLMARFGEGEQAYEHLTHLVTDFATDTLLDLCPPHIFQIDGNLGGAAAVLEMLLQSYGEVLHLLPALPGAWPEGRVTGLRARGGYRVDIEWAGGALVRAAIVALEDRDCAVRETGPGWRVLGPDGTEVRVDRRDGCLRFAVRAGERYLITT